MKYLKDEDDSKDAVMQIFENLLNGLFKHRVTNFKTWLYTITKNHCLMQLRKAVTINKYREEELKRVNHSVVESLFDMHLINENNTDQMLEKLSIGITRLSEAQSKCIELMYIREKSYKEIASLTGYNLKQVKSYIQNGKRNLKKYLSENI
ncbi:MAG: RNA polymerase sigma factor [Bacteroidales bacterium]|nr:MAG: RNA polymerase sigma factor [Bacteroidales bacterium]